MLDIERCTEYLAEVRAFADKTNQRAQLESKLDWLANAYDPNKKGNVRTRLFKDFAPYSFEFVIEEQKAGQWTRIINGGLIYHGAHDGGGNGGAPTFAVSLVPTNGWSIHT